MGEYNHSFAVFIMTPYLVISQRLRYRPDEGLAFIKVPAWVVMHQLAEEHGEATTKGLLLPNPDVLVATQSFEGTFTGGVVFILDLPKDRPFHMRFAFLPAPTSGVWSFSTAPSQERRVSSNLFSKIIAGEHVF